jgi:hypothetical protein
VRSDSIGVRCDADRAHIDVGMGGASQSSSIDLRVLAAEHRPRAVALAAAELVHSMSSHPPVAEAPAPPPPPTPVVAAPPETPDRVAHELAPPPPRRPMVFAGALVEMLGKPAALLLGGRVALEFPIGGAFVPTISADAAFGALHARLADVKIRGAGAAAHLDWATTVGRVRWQLGPGARIDYAHLAADPVDPSRMEGRTLAAAWGGPEVRARIAYAPPHSPAFALEIGAGYVTWPIRGLVDGTDRIYSIEGPWASLCAEIGLGL